jgi:hypothetical protein
MCYSDYDLRVLSPSAQLGVQMKNSLTRAALLICLLGLGYSVPARSQAQDLGTRAAKLGLHGAYIQPYRDHVGCHVVLADIRRTTSDSTTDLLEADLEMRCNYDAHSSDSRQSPQSILQDSPLSASISDEEGHVYAFSVRSIAGMPGEFDVDAGARAMLVTMIPRQSLFSKFTWINVLVQIGELEIPSTIRVTDVWVRAKPIAVGSSLYMTIEVTRGAAVSLVAVQSSYVEKIIIRSYWFSGTIGYFTEGASTDMIYFGEGPVYFQPKRKVSRRVNSSIELHLKEDFKLGAKIPLALTFHNQLGGETFVNVVADVRR